MKAIIVQKKDENFDLVLSEVETPRPTLQQLLVKVRAFGINRADVHQKRGLYPPPSGESSILGLELAGEVVSVPEGIEEYKKGDRVFALVGGGAYAEYCTVPIRMAIKIPPSLGFPEAAGIPETFFTANELLFEQGCLKPGETVLIHAAGSGVGTTAIQLAKAKGATVIVTAGSDDKIDRLLKLGADRGFNYTTRDFSEKVAPELTNQVDLILDCIGAKYFEAHLKLLKEKGRIVQYATLGGKSASLDLSTLMYKRLSLRGFALRRQSLKEKIAITERFERYWLPAIGAGTLKPIIHATFPWAQISEAHALLESRSTFGKIVITLPS